MNPDHQVGKMDEGDLEEFRNLSDAAAMPG